MSSPQVFVLDRESGRCVYRADSLPQAVGYVDRRRKPSIVALSASTFGTALAYRLAMVDSTTGQIVARGPLVSLFDAVDDVFNMRVVILPVTDAEAEAEVLA